MKMQCGGSSVLLLLAMCICASAKLTAHHRAHRFGPKDCVHVTKSSVGSCMISTTCTGLDTTHIDFAFNCVKKQGITRRHSYGTGSFEPTEEFDSEVKCDTCERALPIGVQAAPPGLDHASVAKVPAPLRVASSRKQHTHTPVDSPAPAFELQHVLPARVMPPSGILKTSRHVKAEHHHKHKELAHHVEMPKATSRREHIRLRAKHHKAKSEESEAGTSGTSMGMEPPWGGDVGLTSDEGDKSELEKPKHADEGEKSVAHKEKHEVVKYGPDNCVSTFRNTKGECVMQTRCVGVNISDYEFGLLCIDKVGVPVKHLFGKDSFGQEEKFDTLIKCHECLSLDAVHTLNATAPLSPIAAIGALSKEVEDLTKMVSTISANVVNLNAAVFKKPKAPAPAAPVAAPATKASTNFLHRSSSSKKQKQKQPLPHKAAYIQSKRDDDDDDDDEDEDSDGNDWEARATSDEEEDDRADRAERRESEEDSGSEFDNEKEDREESDEDVEAVKLQRASAKRLEDDEEDDGNDSDAGPEKPEESDKHRLQLAAVSHKVKGVAHQTAAAQKSKHDDEVVDHDDVDADHKEPEESVKQDTQPAVEMGPSRSADEEEQVLATEEAQEGDANDNDGFA